MAKPKGLIAIRLTESEKEGLERKAKDLGMTLSQYVRYKVLEDDSMQYNEQREQGAMEFLDKHIGKLSRIIIDGYFCTKAMAVNQLNEEEKKIISKSGLKQYKELGIVKGKERHGKQGK